MKGLDTILIADDNKLNVTALKKLLNIRFDSVILGVHSSKEALHAIQNITINLVLCDGYIDNRTGIDIYDEAKKYCEEKQRKLPAFVLQTGSGQDFKIPCAQRNIPMVTKPIYMRDLEKALKEALEYRSSQSAVSFI